MKAKEVDENKIVESIFDSCSTEKKLFTSEKVKDFVIAKRNEITLLLEEVEKEIIILQHEKKELESALHSQNHVLNILKLTTK